MASQQSRTIERLKMESELIKSSTKDGIPDQYCLKKTTHNLDPFTSYRKLTFGKQDKNKPQKTILMVGETGTGKTTLINAMINYMLGVKREHKVWFGITDDQCQQSSAYIQTSIITVYGLYLQESLTDLTIIDTPGYGDVRGAVNNKEIATGLLNLNISTEKIHEIDAVCLVIKASETYLSNSQRYIFDAIQCLFGKDFAENIVLLFTHSDGAHPKNALKAVREAKVKCAVNDKNKPVFFLFNNCQSEPADEEDEEDDEDREQRLDRSWNCSYGGMERLFTFLDTIKPKSLKMTEDVLHQRKQLEAKIPNLLVRIKFTELKQNKLKQTKAALEKNKEHLKKNESFEFEVEVPYKEKVDIDRSRARMAMCCTYCEENCHYPGCWRINDLLECSVMKNDHCRVCTNKCHYKEHVKGAKIYETKTRKEKRTYEDLKKEYKIEDGESVDKKLEDKLHELDIEKVKRIFDAFYCMKVLDMITFNSDSLKHQHIDDLIEKMKEINESDKVETLEDIKKRAEEEKSHSVKLNN